jgi:hypothetical protein
MGFSNYGDVEAALRAESDLWGADQNKPGFEAANANANAARAWWANYQSAPPAPQSPPPPPPPPPTPPSPWITTSSYKSPSGIKQAQPDIVLDSEVTTSADYIAERFFEELGGTELINLSRHDLIDGVQVSYNPIANLSKLRQRFNPNNIIATDALSDSEFARSSIDLVSRGMNIPLFNSSGNLIVEVDIIRSEENIEVEISQSGTLTRIEL